MDEQDDLLQLFMTEAAEQVEILTSALLALENDPSNAENVNVAFRAAHTLKGGAATVEFEKVAELTHTVEDLLVSMRSGKLRVGRDLVSLLLKAVDTVSRMLEEYASEGTTSVDISTLKEQLVSFEKSSGKTADHSGEPVKGQKKLSVPEDDKRVEAGSRRKRGRPKKNVLQKEESANDGLREEKESNLQNRVVFQLDDQDARALENAHEKGIPVYDVRVVFENYCMMKSVGALMVVNKLRSFGEVISISPDLDSEEMEKTDEFRVLFASPVSPAEIEKNAATVTITSKIIVEPATEDKPCLVQILEEKHISSSEREATGEGGSVSRKMECRDTGNADSEHYTVKEQPPGETVADGSKKIVSQTVRVEYEKLDEIMNLVGELVIGRSMIARVAQNFEETLERSENVSRLIEANQFIGRVLNELQDRVMKVRMLPINEVFKRFPRIVRDLSLEKGKKIELLIEGRETELDKTIIDSMFEPLLHLVRNAVDHGIETPEERVRKGKKETGIIELRASHEGNHIVVEVANDGASIDIEKIKRKAIANGLVTEADLLRMSTRDIVNLIFLPGFSTAEKITDTSGRGVGMDVVKRVVEKLKGVIDVELSWGAREGTKFIIRLPLTLAIIRALLVRVSGTVYAIPLSSVLEIAKLPESEIYSIRGCEAIRLRDRLVGLLRLSELLYGSRQKSKNIFVVIVGMGEERFGFVTDGLIGEQEIVIKPLEHRIVSTPIVSGASILGDGTIALILDVPELVNHARARGMHQLWRGV